MLPCSMYSDGGCCGKNPSPIGGTWAFCWVSAAGEIVRTEKGVITPEDVGLPAVSNNVAELWAAYNALMSVPDDWTGTLWTDSRITFWRVTGGKSFNGITPGFRKKVLERRRNRKYVVKLLKGHPTREDLWRGCTKDGKIVSEFNAWADRCCTAMAKRFKKGLT